MKQRKVHEACPLNCCPSETEVGKPVFHLKHYLLWMFYIAQLTSHWASLRAVGMGWLQRAKSINTRITHGPAPSTQQLLGAREHSSEQTGCPFSQLRVYAALRSAGRGNGPTTLFKVVCVAARARANMRVSPSVLRCLLYVCFCDLLLLRADYRH